MLMVRDRPRLPCVASGVTMGRGLMCATAPKNLLQCERVCNLLLVCSLALDGTVPSSAKLRVHLVLNILFILFFGVLIFQWQDFERF